MSDSTPNTFSLDAIRVQMQQQLAALQSGITSSRERKSALAVEREAFIEGQRKERETLDENIKNWVAEADQIERALKGMAGAQSRSKADDEAVEPEPVEPETPSKGDIAPAFQPV